MGPIQLRVENKNLLNAWDLCRTTQIENYADLHSDQKMKIQNFINRSPGMLTFSVNRLSFDNVRHELVKNNMRFEFEKIIYLDLHMITNREKVEEKAKLVSKYNEKIRNLKDEIKAKEDDKIMENLRRSLDYVKIMPK